MTHQSFRSPLARAVGLGSAKNGVRHWWTQRITAVALLPLSVWFVALIIAHAGSEYAVFKDWVRTPLATSCMILFLITLFYHSASGLQVVIEDYIHSGAKFVAVIAVRLCCYGLAVVGIIATMRISFG
jgi:succinate dehydrogenase / fumarate reductase membrane anchor subunit